MKRFFFILTFALFSLYPAISQVSLIPISFFAQNAWMPDTIGDCGANCHFGGKLDSNWTNVQQSKVKLMRFGGKSVDKRNPAVEQYLSMVDSMRAHDMEPILQVPYSDNLYGSGNAVDIVRYINVTNARNVKYWIIGNEPDRYANFNTASQISAYIKAFSIAMRRVDPSIKIIGPGLSYITTNTSDNQYKRMDTLLRYSGPDTVKSITGIIPSGHSVASGKPYIDYFSYHMYNYKGDTAASRPWAISRLTGTDSARMGWLKRRLDLCNANLGWRANYPLKPVITEANLCYYAADTLTPGDTLTDLKASGFYAGQHWCETMALGMVKGLEWINFWSVMEGNGGGYMSNSSSPAKKSTYQHIQKMGQWFRDSIFIAHTTRSTLKAYAAKAGGYIAVLVLNEADTATPDQKYKLSLNNISGDTIDFNMHISATYRDTIKASSSTLLLFSCTGNIARKYRYELADTAHPFKQVWAASSPDSILTVDAGPDVITGSCCNARLQAYPNITSGTTYHWYELDSTSSFSTSNPTTANPGNTTTYKVTATNGSCTAIDYFTVVISGDYSCPANCDEEQGRPGDRMSASTKAIFGSALFSCVPNPFSNRTKISYSLGSNCKKASLLISDPRGKLMAELLLDPASDHTEVDCSAFEPGIYFYTLSVNDKKVGTKKMIVLN
ncbi:MAG: T9SS type A sorting domain-containing protein [Bacteroidia bacterium]